MPVVTDEPLPEATATPLPEATATPAPEATAVPGATPTMPVVTDEPLPEATATPAPVYEEVPVSEEVHGVKVEEAPEMVRVLMAVAEDVESENSSIDIVNAEKVLTPEEKDALDVLPAREQLMTFLSVIGFEVEVNAAMEESEIELSAEALALKASILERMAAMEESERAAFEAMLLESFPQEVIEIDGVEYEFFIIELEIRRGDELHYERYGFRREGETWILTRLERAAAGSAR